MDFSFSEEQGFVRDTIQKFITRECDREVVKKLDEEGQFPDKLFSTVAQMGFCGLTIPQEYGGGGVDTLGASMVTEELAAISPVLAGAFCATTFSGGFVIGQLGSEDQKEKFLPDIVEGSLCFAYGIEEPESNYGSVSAQTVARKSTEGFLLEGSKTFVRCADRADYITVLATTDGGADPRNGLTFFLVDMRSQGVKVEPIEKVGFHSTSLCTVMFDNVLVPVDGVLGGEEMCNKGWSQIEKIMAVRHVEIASIGIGLAQGAYEYALNYAKEREQFGQPISRFGAVRSMLADIAIGIQTGRDLLYRACWKADSLKGFLKEAVMARIVVSQVAQRAAMDCMQVLGGYGYANEYDAQRYLRDSMVLFEGKISSDELKNSLATILGMD